MSITLWTSSPNAGPMLPLLPASSTAYTAGKLLAKSAGTVVETTGTTITLVALGQETKTTESSNPTIKALLIAGGPSQMFIADCTANTATNQLFKTQAMTDAATVNNTSTENTTTAGIFFPVAIVGAATDKKLLGYFIRIGQVTA